MGTRCEKQAIDIAWNIVDFTEYENDSENAERQLPRLGSGVRIASPAPFSPDIRDITHARARLTQCYAADVTFAHFNLDQAGRVGRSSWTTVVVASAFPSARAALISAS